MECRQLDRNRRPAKHSIRPRRHGGVSNRRERSLIGGEINSGIRPGEGRLAEHVIGEAIAFCLERLRDIERFGDRPAKHELPAHDPHGLFHGIADEGLA